METFVKWNNAYLDFKNENSIMYSTEALRISNYFNSYLIKLYILIDKVNLLEDKDKKDLACQRLGELLAKDFDNFSTDFQRACRIYFNQDRWEKIIEEEDAFKKPKQSEENEYLGKTFLYSSFQKIEKELMDILQ